MNTITTKPQFWTMFCYGGNWTVCSKHWTAGGAKRAARACECRGGAKHIIVKVERVK